MIYFIKQDNHVKIGKSVEPGRRLAGLQTLAPVKLDMLLVMPEDQYKEKMLHDMFFRYHERGEWFSLEGELKEFIDEHRMRAQSDVRRIGIIIRPGSYEIQSSDINEFVRKTEKKCIVYEAGCHAISICGNRGMKNIELAIGGMAGDPQFGIFQLAINSKLLSRWETNDWKYFNGNVVSWQHLGKIMLGKMRSVGMRVLVTELKWYNRMLESAKDLPF